MRQIVIATIVGLLLLALASNVRAGDAVDTVLLVNGGRVRGTVLVDDPAKGVTVRMADGKTRALNRAEIKSVEYADAQSPQPPPATQAPVAPPPVSAPPIARDDADRHAHSEEQVERSSLKPVWIGGMILTLSVWALRAGITFGICASYGPQARGCDGQDYAGAVLPVVGAWVQAAQGIGGDHGATSGGVFAAIVGAGLAETAGFAMFIIGLAVHHDVVTNPTDAWLHVGPLRLVPSVTPRAVGLTGAF